MPIQMKAQKFQPLPSVEGTRDRVRENHRVEVQAFQGSRQRGQQRLTTFKADGPESQWTSHPGYSTLGNLLTGTPSPFNDLFNAQTLMRRVTNPDRLAHTDTHGRLPDGQDSPLLCVYEMFRDFCD